VRYALPQPYRDLDHTADVGVAVEGGSADEALARLVLAYAALLSGGAPVEVAREEQVVVTAPGGGAALALALLRELLFRFAVERLVPGACEVTRLAPDEVEVTVGFGRYDPERHADGLDLKAVTRHAARFERGADGVWRSQVVFDI
jgi:SHS2 domain-containing protein